MQLRFLVGLIVLSFVIFGQGGCKRNQPPEPNSVSAAGAGLEGDRARAQELLAQGKEFYKSDQEDKAKDVFEQAIKLDPNLAEAHFRLGLTYDFLGLEQEAQDSYKTAIEKYKKYLDDHQDDAEAHYNLGQAYAGRHFYMEAVREYREATRLKDDDADMYYDLGSALSKLAQYDQAVAAFSKSLEIDPNNYRAEDALEEAREGVKRIRAGKKHQEDLLRKQKEKELKETEAAGSPGASPASTRRPG